MIELSVETIHDPADNDFEYAVVKAESRDDWANYQEAYGTAHIDRGDDPLMLLEIAALRAKRRVLAITYEGEEFEEIEIESGVGMLSYDGE